MVYGGGKEREAHVGRGEGKEPVNPTRRLFRKMRTTRSSSCRPPARCRNTHKWHVGVNGSDVLKTSLYSPFSLESSKPGRIRVTGPRVSRQHSLFHHQRKGSAHNSVWRATLSPGRLHLAHNCRSQGTLSILWIDGWICMWERARGVCQWPLPVALMSACAGLLLHPSDMTCRGCQDRA